jgi:leader peptidase (prepilin peptidase) / N-methyltransferase
MGAGVAVACVLAWLVALSVYDVRERRLPNWLTIPGALAVLAVAVTTGRGAPALLGAVVLAGLYLVVHVIAPAAMGAGDVKLAVGLGGLTGAFGLDVWALAALAAPLLTGVLACWAMTRPSEPAVPHGPSMCVATVAATMLAIL